MDDLDRVKQILKSHGIMMSVDGSDEGGGPWVTVEYGGAESLEVGAFDMFFDKEYSAEMAAMEEETDG